MTAATCLEIRDLLPELATGVLPEEERTGIERHVRWCAGCRKEAADLEIAAATFGLTLAPAPLPEDLEERVLARVREESDRRRTRPLRARMAVAAMVGSMFLVASLGWGAVMAGRADRFEDRARVAEAQRVAALQRFQQVAGSLIPTVEFTQNDTHLGRLTPTDGRGGGAVLQVVSPRLIDFSIVIVNGLDPAASDRLPYRVVLSNGAGATLQAGRIDALDDNGGGEAYRQFDTQDLTGFTNVRVVDADGVVVLKGTVDQGV